MACFKTKSPGQSLIEVVVASGVLSLLLIALLSLVSLSVKNSRLAKDRTQAVSLAQEGVELMRAYRDSDWSGFSAKAGSIYELPDNWTVAQGLTAACPATYEIHNLFKRCVGLTSGDNSITVAVTVSWKEGDQVKETVQTTNLSLWER